MRRLLLLVSHFVAVAGGFAGGIYVLPILTAPAAPTATEVAAVASRALWRGQFDRNLPGSDWLHWGEGQVAVAADAIALAGELAPGPDYKLYLSPELVTTEDQFERVKPRMVRVGDVRTFENFIVAVPASVDPARYAAVVVWCETFSQFITAAQYRESGEVQR